MLGGSDGDVIDAGGTVGDNGTTIVGTPVLTYSIGLNGSDPDQVVIGARYDGEVFATRDAGATWEAMPLPAPVKDIYSVACG